MQSDSTHTMITRNRAANQSATVKPVLAIDKPTTRSQTQVKLLSSSSVQEPRMVTRSRNNASRYDVDIDFDEASEAWRANKKSIGNGMFKYVGMRTRSKM